MEQRLQNCELEGSIKKIKEMECTNNDVVIIL